MIAQALILIGTALGSNSTEAGVAVPDGVLAPAPAETVTVAPAPTAPMPTYVPPREPADLLVGRAAWLDQKYALDPMIDADHGRPTVVFEVADPVLEP